MLRSARRGRGGSLWCHHEQGNASGPADLAVTATSDDGEVMGVRHRTLAVEGVQFHPEAILTEHGKALLVNFLAMAKEFRAVAA